MSAVYNPIPPRTWPRISTSCSSTNQMETKAYILQHNENKFKLTRNQQYSRLATTRQQLPQCATQSETYTNPNLYNLERVNYTVIHPNTFIGQPNNPSGPYQTKVDNPNGCQSDSLIAGGVLLCGTRTTPCNSTTNIPFYDFSVRREKITCHPASASNVPGKGILCASNHTVNWKPRVSRSKMSTSSITQPIPNNVACVSSSI